MKEIYDYLHKESMDKKSPFYMKEHTNGNHTYHVFSYHMSSYADFKKSPYAYETRGSMFLINEDTVQMVCRPMNKFFNIYENPSTEFSDTEYPVNRIKYAMIKMDGSVINTYLLDNALKLKSHTSLNSEVQQKAYAYLSTCPIEFRNELLDAEQDGYTVNMEYTASSNQIVLEYEEENLTVLNLRHRETGELLLGDDIKSKYPVLYTNSVFYKVGDIHPLFPIKETLSETIEACRVLEDIEGFVLIFDDGEMCKVKTQWYCTLHSGRSYVEIPGWLFNVVLNEESDDLRSFMLNSPKSLERIEKMEQIVFLCYNTIIKESTLFYEQNKHLPLKEYAIKANAEVTKEFGILGVTLNLYHGKKTDFKRIIRGYKQKLIKGFGE